MKHLLPIILASLSVILSLPFKGEAIGPAAQALLADHFLRTASHYSDEEKTAFRAGTLFSGIWMLSPADKPSTTFEEVALQDVIAEPSPFVAGMKFHCLVEDLRASFIRENNSYSLLDHLAVNNHDTFLRFVEDHVVLPSVDKELWKSIAKDPHEEELRFGLREETLTRWHYLLNLSYNHNPSTLIFFAHLKGNGLLHVPKEEVALWNQVFKETANSNAAKAYVDELLKMFAHQLAQTKRSFLF